MIVIRALAALALVAGAGSAHAASLDIETSTDLRRRGLSWSDGKPAIDAWATVPLTGGFSVIASAATLRGSPRHGGADAVAETALRYMRQAGAWTLSADIQYLAFLGTTGQNYAQLRATAARDIGPVQLAVQTDWAPPQAAIGGSNFYLGGRASLGLPGTPVTLAASLGRSMGNDYGSVRSRRLRPGGDYTDFRLDADYVLDRVTLGASFTTTTIRGERAENSSPRLLIRAAIGF